MVQGVKSIHSIISRTFLKINSFIYFWLCWVFVTVQAFLCGEWGLLSSNGACGGFSCCGAQALEHRFSSCGTQAYLL